MSSDATRPLRPARESDDEGGLDRLIPLVYDELRALAANRLAGEGAGHTLQPTALVHEAYARLAEGEVKFVDRAHFFALAARTMRRVLVDHARGKRRAKRGGGGASITLTEGAAVSDPASFDVLALDDALSVLAKVDPRKADVVELHYFGGLTYSDIAISVGISEATVDRDLRLARAWLAERLS
jgi:RNA polymerase sigma factor (TIGR02999 family)